MARSKRLLLSFSCLLAAATGCGGRVDITQTLVVQRSGVLGLWYETTGESRLAEQWGSTVLELSAGEKPAAASGKATIQSGTRLVTNRVVRINQSVGFPFYLLSDCLFAMILDGPDAGTEVLITNGVLGSIPDNKVLKPTTRPAGRSKALGMYGR